MVIVKVMNGDGSFSFLNGVDEHDKPVKRSKSDYPYSYDGFVTWRGLPQKEMDHTLYSDHLKRQNHEKWDELCNKHFGEEGDYFSSRTPTAIQAFIRELLDKPNYELGLIMEYCNVSNGFPVWRFDIKVHKTEQQSL